jgi:hypothetical protein
MHGLNDDNPTKALVCDNGSGMVKVRAVADEDTCHGAVQRSIKQPPVLFPYLPWAQLPHCMLSCTDLLKIFVVGWICRR